MNAAMKVWLQIRARLPGVLVDREVRRGREGRHDTAQSKAVRAVRLQAGAHPRASTRGVAVAASHKASNVALTAGTRCRSEVVTT